MEITLLNLSKQFHCIEVGAVDADVRRTVRLTWRGLGQHLNLPRADGEEGCVGEAVDDVLYGFLRVGEKGAANSRSVSMILKKMENSVGARTHPCLRWGSCLTVTHCASPDLADLHAAGGAL